MRKDRRGSAREKYRESRVEKERIRQTKYIRQEQERVSRRQVGGEMMDSGLEQTVQGEEDQPDRDRSGTKLLHSPKTVPSSPPPAGKPGEEKNIDQSGNDREKESREVDQEGTEETGKIGSEVTSERERKNETKTSTIEYPKVEQNAFEAGEKLSYKISYFLLTAGYSNLNVYPGEPVDGRQTYHIRMSTWSIPLFWFRVKDELSSVLDREGLFSYRHEKHQRQGKKRKDEVVLFYPEQGSAKRTRDGVTDPLYQVPSFSLDVLGALYRVRAFDLEPGTRLEIPVFDGRKVYDLVVEVWKRERISVPAGKFQTILIKPRLQSEGIFLDKGDVLVWLSDDQYKVPVLIKVKIPIGSLVAKLTEYKLSPAMGK